VAASQHWRPRVEGSGGAACQNPYAADALGSVLVLFFNKNVKTFKVEKLHLKL